MRRQQISQLNKLTKLNITDDQLNTVLDIGWTREGNTAYKTCLAQSGNKPPVSIDLSNNANEYSNTFVVSLSYHPNVSSSPKTFEINCITGCPVPREILNNATKIGEDETVSVKITRDPKIELQLNASVQDAGTPANFSLPPAPLPVKTRYLQWTIDPVGQSAYNFCVPDTQDDAFRACTQDSAADRNFPCIKGPYQSDLARGEEILIGSGMVTKQNEWGTSGNVTQTPDTESAHELCFGAGSPAGGNFATFRVEVTIVAPDVNSP